MEGTAIVNREYIHKNNSWTGVIDNRDDQLRRQPRKTGPFTEPEHKTQRKEVLSSDRQTK